MYECIGVCGEEELERRRVGSTWTSGAGVDEGVDGVLGGYLSQNAKPESRISSQDKDRTENEGRDRGHSELKTGGAIARRNASRGCRDAIRDCGPFTSGRRRPVAVAAACNAR